MNSYVVIEHFISAPPTSLFEGICNSSTPQPIPVPVYGYITSVTIDDCIARIKPCTLLKLTTGLY